MRTIGYFAMYGNNPQASVTHRNITALDKHLHSLKRKPLCYVAIFDNTYLEDQLPPEDCFFFLPLTQTQVESIRAQEKRKK
jgi:hypothetical protein